MNFNPINKINCSTISFDLSQAGEVLAGWGFKSMWIFYLSQVRRFVWLVGFLSLHGFFSTKIQKYALEYQAEKSNHNLHHQ